MHTKKKPDYFCKIYSALEFGSSIQTSIRNGWIFFMSDCFFVLPQGLCLYAILQQMHRGADYSHIHTQMIEHAQMDQTI